jgi:hypothetical protein
MCLFSASTGIIITDNVLFYEGDLKITALMTGDTVAVTMKNTDTVFVECNNKAGTLLQGVLIDLADTIAEEQLFMFARGYHDEQAFPQAMRLFQDRVIILKRSFTPDAHSMNLRARELIMIHFPAS